MGEETGRMATESERLRAAAEDMGYRASAMKQNAISESARGNGGNAQEFERGAREVQAVGDLLAHLAETLDADPSDYCAGEGHGDGECGAWFCQTVTDALVIADLANQP